MNITFDVLTRELTIDEPGDDYGGAQISAALNRHGHTVSLVGVSFGLSVEADGEEVLAHDWPPHHVRYIKTDQDVLTTIRASWQPGQLVKIKAWCVTTTGGLVEADREFTAAIPPEPGPEVPDEI
jgi:hypothetical protein